MVALKEFKPKEIPQEYLELLVASSYQSRVKDERLQRKVTRPSYTSGKGTRMVPEHMITRYAP